MTYKTREEWLIAFTDAARPVFKEHGYEIPANVRMSVGFTSKGARSTRIGECWSTKCSEDDVFEIFIDPKLSEASRIADVLTHELAHATVGIEAGHKKPFVDCVRAVGLEGKPTATVAGDAWRAWAEPILEKLGKLPHGAIQPGSGGAKKQSTRMLKCECTQCGFVFRTSSKWIEQYDGDLACPAFACDGVQVSIG